MAAIAQQEEPLAYGSHYLDADGDAAIRGGSSALERPVTPLPAEEGVEEN